jgi:hypothetical protein
VIGSPHGPGRPEIVSGQLAVSAPRRIAARSGPRRSALASARTITPGLTTCWSVRVRPITWLKPGSESRPNSRTASLKTGGTGRTIVSEFAKW